MMRTIPLLLALSGCTVQYDFVNDIGGEMTVSITPVGAEGVTLASTRAGMTDEELTVLVDTTENFPACPAPRLSWALDAATSEPLYGSLVFCAPEVEVAPDSCGSPVALTVEVDGGDGASWTDLTPAEPGDTRINALGTFELGADGLQPTGSLSGTIELTDDCIGDAVQHDIVLEWNFPIHDERSTEVPNELCCGPLVAALP